MAADEAFLEVTSKRRFGMSLNSRVMWRKVALTLMAWVFLAAPSYALCGKECKEAKSYCSKWEKDHPGEECGTVRGAICNVPLAHGSWKKIKQVNIAWSACELVKGEDDHEKAVSRCNEYQKNIGGSCEVHSPHCKAGWVKLGDYGVFQACRHIAPSGSLLYDGYKAFMRKWEGKADTHMHPALQDFVKAHYPSVDVARIRWGLVGDTPRSTCITDCYDIYCDKDTVLDQVKNGRVESGTLIFHELTHVEQCQKQGGREEYAKYWFRNLPQGFFNAIDGNVKDDFKADVHDKMPMESGANRKGEAVTEEYAQDWWLKRAYCRIYDADKTTVLFRGKELQSRADCDPRYDGAGWRELREAVKDVARDHGSGTYWFAFGRPELGQPKTADDKDAGLWLAQEVVNVSGARRTGADGMRPPSRNH
jgi:hypothetical protein